MGILDKFKKTKSEDKNPSPEDVIKKDYFKREAHLKESEHVMGEFEGSLKQLDQTPGMQTFHSMAHEEATQLQQEFKTREFESQHKKIVDFKKEFDHIKFLEEYGIPYTGSKSEYMKRYEMLCSSKVMHNRYIDKMFLPYLVEKKALGIITKDEQAELDVIFAHTHELEDIRNGTFTSNFASDYKGALTVLGVIGTLDFGERSAIRNECDRN